ncbi:uncharacterized protein BX664DRAFT_317801 [Halteromyces radiatus]|uniref:uncharacterized protein n=1 Tax=Halteromyces radiatus TaxID=101107 RepID=UPI0022204D32|nr:uncharacterized protein BX664DRAFT_317801 [Halteromyces radiatus]KAI8079909.1 hypothetical protein BX664DRAFT_317801 [Halteromyces radiatus]
MASNDSHILVDISNSHTRHILTSLDVIIEQAPCTAVNVFGLDQNKRDIRQPNGTLFTDICIAIGYQIWNKGMDRNVIYHIRRSTARGVEDDAVLWQSDDHDMQINSLPLLMMIAVGRISGTDLVKNN